MSAREILTSWFSGYANPEGRADATIEALTAAGYRILSPDELDTVTVERCITAIACGCTGECPSPGNCARDDVAELRHLGEKE